MEGEIPYERLHNESESSSRQQQQQQQQQQEALQVFVLSGSQQQQIVKKVKSYIGHIVFAFIVFWCCNWVVGLIAFTLAS